MGEAASELEKAFLGFRTTAEELVRGGGGEGQMTQRLRHLLADDLGWHKHTFEIKKTVDGVAKESTSHIIDHVKRFSGGTIALETEWNYKGPLDDRRSRMALNRPG